ncbi:MAG: ZIP family metal transporter [Dermatophilaceae bacterium]|nr:ZIP family metal transporter [Dermatophilaceae bacterium]
MVALIATGLAVLAALAGSVLPDRTGPPVESLVVERTVLSAPGTIELVVRNAGPDPVTVAQVSVNDAFVAVTGGEQPIGRLASETLRLDYPWENGLPYTVSLLTSTGAVIEHAIPMAAATPAATSASLLQVALLGVMIGVVPVLLGMTTLPLLRRAGPTASRVLMALTVGLLAFLAVDAGIEGLEVGAAGAAAFGGSMLFVLGAALAFLLLAGTQRLIPDTTRAGRVALLVAIGIGVHNLGEGLAVGSALAVGELALGTSLVVGFALHNTTEGMAVVAPLTALPPVPAQPDRTVRPGRLLLLAIVAGGPAVVGTVLGATLTTESHATFLLGLGVGAIVQVIVLLVPQLRRPEGGLDLPVAAGLGAGVVLMYVTGLLVAA